MVLVANSARGVKGHLYIYICRSCVADFYTLFNFFENLISERNFLKFLNLNGSHVLSKISLNNNQSYIIT